MERSSGGTGRDDDPTLDADTHWSQVAQRHYDPDSDRELTTAIVVAIAAARDVAPSDVTDPPLYDCVDVAALEDAFFGADVGRRSRQGIGAVEFRYEEFLVKVGSDGWIRVYESRDEDLP